MKFTLLIVGNISEQIVAKFRSQSEAFHCGSLLQASTNDENQIYYVESKLKGQSKRQQVDRFTHRLPFLNDSTKQDLQQYYNYIK